MLSNNELKKYFDINKPRPFTTELLRIAIENHLVIRIVYATAGFSYRQRDITPTTYGTRNGHFYLRGFHLSGYSRGAGGFVSREWRLFRTDRISTIAWTGSRWRTQPPLAKTTDEMFTVLIHY